jgi:hypothetical protein
MGRPVFALRVRAQPGVSDVIRNLRGWLKQGYEALVCAASMFTRN